MIFPKGFPLQVKRFLLGNLESCHSLPGILARVPFLSGVFYRLLVQVLEKLYLEEIFCVVVLMEVLEPFVVLVGSISVGSDGLVGELLLGCSVGYQTVFEHVVAETVGSLRVLSERGKVRIGDLESTFLQFRILPLLKFLVHLLRVEKRSQSHADVEDLSRRFRVCQFNSGSAVELDVLCGWVGTVCAGGQEVALDVEQLDTESTRRWYGVGKAWVTWFGRIATCCWEGAWLGKEFALTKVWWKCIMDCECSLHNAVRSAVRAGVDMSVVIKLLPLLCIDLLGHGLDVFLFTWWRIFNALGVPSKVLAMGKVIAGGARSGSHVDFETLFAFLTGV